MTWQRAAVALAVSLSLTACTDSSSSAAPAGDGRFVVDHARVPKALRPLAAEVKKDRTVEKAVALVDERVALSDDVAVVVRSCKDGTGYDPNEREIQICLQDVQETRDLLENAEAEDVAATEDGILTETVTHEAGHALADVLDLQFTGREEDVADQFSAFVLVDAGNAGLDDLESAAYGYEVSASAYEAEDADEHSSDAQRAINIQCWIYGSDERDSDHLVSKDGLTRARADICGEEWTDLRDGWTHLLEEAGALKG